MIELVSRKVSLQKSDDCLSQRAFHVLRRFFVENKNVSRKRFKLDTLLNDIIPHGETKTIWNDLKFFGNFNKWPELKRPLIISFLVIITSFLLASMTVFFSIPLQSFNDIGTTAFSSMLHAFFVTFATMILLFIRFKIPYFKDRSLKLFTSLSTNSYTLIPLLIIISSMLKKRISLDIFSGAFHLFCFTIFLYTGFYFTRPWMKVIPKKYLSVRDLVHYIIVNPSSTYMVEKNIFSAFSEPETRFLIQNSM